MRTVIALLEDRAAGVFQLTGPRDIYRFKAPDACEVVEPIILSII